MDKPRKINKVISPSGEWASVKEAAPYVDYSERQILRLHNEGWLKYGKHYRYTSPPDAVKPRIQFHLVSLKILVETHPAKRVRYEEPKAGTYCKLKCA